jgi:hypothetical protein
MSDATRILWGKTKAEKIDISEFVDLAFQATAPTAKAGRLYADVSGNLKYCQDGTNWTTITIA